jgi:GNAT superfamily N-acetyltransferase
MAEIKPLKECPDYAPILAYWSYNLWYRKRPIDFDVILKAYGQRAASDRVPLSMVAIEESMPVGMISLKLDDLWSRKDLNPWLASLYVVPEFRNRGIAEMLVNAVVEKARALGYQELYLFLGPEEHMDLALYYSNRGWHYMEDAIDNDDQPTKIFYYSL